MEIEFLSELENKVGTLVDAVNALKAENERMKADFEGSMAGLRGENEDLKSRSTNFGRGPTPSAEGWPKRRSA